MAEIVNPYSNAVLVTNSGIKKDIAAQFGISVIESQEYRLQVAAAEARHDRQNNNGMIVPTLRSLPYEVQVAYEKAKCLPKSDEICITNDAVFEVELPSGQLVALNKPAAPHHPGKLMAFYLQYPRAKVFSNAGIAVIKPNGEIQLLRAECAIGIINPDLDPYKLMNIISSNPDASSGITTLGAFENGLVIPHRFLHFRLTQYQPHGKSLVAGRLVPSAGLETHLSADAVNNSWIRTLSLGIVPP